MAWKLSTGLWIWVLLLLAAGNLWRFYVDGEHWYSITVAIFCTFVAGMDFHRYIDERL